jgi:hypothetical protein
MRSYVEASARHPNAARIAPLLDRIIPDGTLHARFVNTLARMEYVGVRKILKSRRAEHLDLDGLQHILDEAVHALRLKKAAAALAGREPGRTGQVTTFADSHTLAGAAGEGYLQALDHRAEAALSDLPEGERAEANYLLTSAAIEVRAQVFYPIYDERLRALGAGFSVAAISKDEDRHLAEMEDGLSRRLGDWRPRLEPLLETEEVLFGRFLAQIEGALPASLPALAAVAG